MDKTRIIVVEDNIVYCEFVCNLLAREGFRTVQAYHLSTAKKLLQQASDGDIVVSDLRLPDGDGIDLLRWMRKEGMTQPLIIMTNYAEVHTAVESMKLGSLDYIPKQLVEDKLMPLLHTILKERSIGRNRMPVFARDSSAFQKIMQQIRLVAPTDMSVLIFGENGTGKEHIAHHLHDKSKRAGKPFVPVDCGSLSKDLAPSAFFGHVKGAFTGADSTKKGYFNEAEGVRSQQSLLSGRRSDQRHGICSILPGWQLHYVVLRRLCGDVPTTKRTGDIIRDAVCPVWKFQLYSGKNPACNMVGTGDSGRIRFPETEYRQSHI